VTLEEKLVLAGDILIFLGFGVTGIVYWLQSAATARRDVAAALAVLLAVKDGMPWGDSYFAQSYVGEDVDNRARQDFMTVQSGNYAQIFHVPTEPLTTLVANPAAGDLIPRETMEAVNVALWQIGVFNQLVDKQTDFNARHLAEIRDDSLPPERREALANAAYSLSHMLHGSGIGDGEWYATLKRELDANVAQLESRRVRSWGIRALDWHRDVARQ
jgi:hypothetical protein